MLALNSTGSKLVTEIRSNTFAFLTMLKWTFLCDFFHNTNNHTASFLLETSNTSDVTLS